tara:strand:+ start:1769 stop:2284 length:516 start_codon:yes stop_codon:yes gene_type:complete
MSEDFRASKNPRLGDLLATQNGSGLASAPKMPPCAAPRLEELIRSQAIAIGEDPDDLWNQVNGKTPLARLVRSLLGEQHPTTRVSRDQELFVLHQKLSSAGLEGRALWDEIKRQRPDTDKASAQRALRRYQKYLRELEMPDNVSEIFAPEFSIDKKVRKRGPKPKLRTGHK